MRQHTGRWHRRQNKFGKLWNQTKVKIAFGHQLLQLDLAAFVLGIYGSEGEQS